MINLNQPISKTLSIPGIFKRLFVARAVLLTVLAMIRDMVTGLVVDKPFFLLLSKHRPSGFFC